jgi:hypothetical protein
MCLRRTPEKYITGAALDRAGVEECAGFNLRHLRVVVGQTATGSSIFFLHRPIT